MERPEFDRLLADALPIIEGAARKYATIYRCLNEWHDISQSALLKMLRFADLYDPAKGDLLPWACVIIINTIKTHIAQSMTMPNMGEYNALIVDNTPGPADYNPEEQAHMAFLTSNLNKEARLFLEGYNYPEIRARCGFKSNVTAMNRIDKCAEHLRKILGLTVVRGKRVKMHNKTPD